VEKAVKNPSVAVEYLLRLADDRLILGHRLSEWCGHAPVLEEDIALANIALDCIGQAGNIYSTAAQLEGKNRTADGLVYFREAVEFRNLLLVEQPNRDFAHTMVRQFFYDAYGLLVYEKLQNSTLAPLAGIAQKAVKEIRYHFRHSSQWMIRLGDGTDESRHRTQSAVDTLWRFTDEMFISDVVEEDLSGEGIAVLSRSLKDAWSRSVTTILTEATIKVPGEGEFQQSGGRAGKHTEHLGHLLAEMQIVARSYPEIQW
jgi:ring-1,2-phenylacetyl-CoA epoxidase subunit PaaC